MIERLCPADMTSTRRQRGFVINPYAHGAGAVDADFASVILLLHAEGADGGTTRTDSSSYARTMTSVSGSITTSTDQAVFGSTSLKVAASAYGEYNSADFTFAADVDFTLETWVYHTAACDVFRLGTEATARLALYIDGSNNVLLNRYADSPVHNCGTVTASTWHHFRVSRQEHIVSVFIDGVWATSDGRPQNYDATLGNGRLIFGNATAATYYDEFRVTRGVARDPYTLAAWPTGGGDANWASVAVYMQMYGTDGSTTFTDEVGKTITVAGNAQIDTAEFKLGAASGLFDGTGDGLTAADHADFTLGSGDFTIEMYVRPASLVAAYGLIAKRANNTIYGPFGIYTNVTTGVVGCLASFNGTTWAVNMTGGALSANRWCHVRYTRTGSAFSLWLNGGLSVTASPGSSALTTNATAVSFAAGAADFNSAFNGHVQHLRITKGVTRDTVNFIPHLSGSANFTLQAAPHPNSA